MHGPEFASQADPVFWGGEWIDVDPPLVPFGFVDDPPLVPDCEPVIGEDGVPLPEDVELPVNDDSGFVAFARIVIVPVSGQRRIIFILHLLYCPESS